MLSSSDGLQACFCKVLEVALIYHKCPNPYSDNTHAFSSDLSALHITPHTHIHIHTRTHANTQVQALLRASGRRDVDVEIVFPVNSRAITTAKQETSMPGASTTSSSNGSSQTGGIELPTGLSVLPGPAMGEGCSLEVRDTLPATCCVHHWRGLHSLTVIERSQTNKMPQTHVCTQGGCASCPYMRMNTLSALRTVCMLFGSGAHDMLGAYKPKLYEQGLSRGEGQPERSIAQAGCTSILHMRDFQQGKCFSDKLVSDIQSRNAH